MSSLSDPVDSAPDGHAEWWRSRSTAELKEIAAAGVAGGDRFMAAVREIERRSQEGFNRTHSVEAESKLRQARRDRQVRAGLALAAVAAAVLAIIVL